MCITTVMADPSVGRPGDASTALSTLVLSFLIPSLWRLG